MKRTWMLSFVTGVGVLAGNLSAFVQESKPQAAEESAPAEETSQEPQAPRPIRAEDYGKFESFGFAPPSLSPDGKWLAYQVSRTNGENELRLRMLATDETKDFDFASGAKFSDDSNYLGFLVGMHADERAKLQKSKKPVRNKLGLHDLTTGETDEIENVQSFSFSDDGKYLVMKRYKAKDAEHDGTDIVLRDLATGLDTNFGNVASYAFNDEGNLLAMIIDAADQAGNGVQVYDAAGGRLQTLDSADAKYHSLAWREDSANLAVMRETEHDEDEDPSHVVLAWRNLDSHKPRAKEYDQTKDESFDEDMRIVTFAGLNWSDDGKTLFFGIKEWDKKPAEKEENEDSGEKKEEEGSEEKEEKPKSKKKEEGDKSLRDTIKEPSNVEVWHAADIDIIPLQKKRAERDKNENFLCGWWLDSGALVQLGNDVTESIRLLEGQKHALGIDNTPYEDQKKFGPTLNDVYLIDVESNDRRKILEAAKYTFGSSPDGRYFTYVRDNNIWVFDITESTHRNLTGDIDTHFINQENSSLTDEKRPYGIAGWSEDGSNLFLYDRYDIWMFEAASGEADRLTNGAEDRIRHRRVVFDSEEDEFIDPDKPMYLSIYGDTTKQFGYARMLIGDRPETLVIKDKNIGRLIKADDAEVYAYVEQDFDDSPDIFTGGTDLDDMKQASATNAFQGDYLWGKSELMTYTNTRGEELQGAIYYPADYEPGKTYPMLVYIYELRSQAVHSYSTPTERHPYNPAVFTSEGYFWFQPDITYRPQNPGVSAVECVVPAVEAMIATGMIDKDRIGLVGHSWGAYQTAFIVTQTDLFAAGVAGAPLTNMMSMSVSIYWNSGQTDTYIFHESQGRMDQPFWRDVDTYIKNSPIFNLDTLNTPLMIAFGTNDGAVDFNQGVELYNAARLVNKDFVMLVYPGENHSVRKKENQVDYHYRVLEWFNHYVRGDEAPKWITEGVTHLERQKEIEKMKKENGGKGGSGGSDARSDATRRRGR